MKIDICFWFSAVDVGPAFGLRHRGLCLAQRLLEGGNGGRKGQQPGCKHEVTQIFLGKLYKNNTSPRSKRMNSIRLNRFNAFLYRVNSPLPNDHKVCRVVHASLLAVLANNRNFEEEEGIHLSMKMKKCWYRSLDGHVKSWRTPFKQVSMIWPSILSGIC